MFKSFVATAAALMFATASFASAAPISLNFDGFSYGTTMNNYYNGGTDSLNRRGYDNYGISFQGGSIKYTPAGGYLSGPVTMTIDPSVIQAILGTDQFYVSFNAGVYGPADQQNVHTYYESGFNENATYVTGNVPPNCHTAPRDCDSRVYYGTMGGYYVYGMGSSQTDRLTKIFFDTDRLDNIEFHSYSLGQPIIRPAVVANIEATGNDIPEPASLALLGVGVAALGARRRENKNAS